MRANPSIYKTGMDSKAPETRKAIPAASGGKLAFSLKQKSKLAAAPVKLGADEDEDEGDAENGSVDGPPKRQKLDQPNASVPLPCKGDVAYVLSLYRPWWKEMLNERIEKCGTPCYKSNLHSPVHALGINQFFK
ncbi:SURP and G-patch domain-containing protein 1-like protein isoform X1 [Telopea speciosissima]|uniref:SURP and G-patch domain-containing protein 1-like protein isoform X1 n=1 Tax=Telopea speciosissima TaxID=54955 RepID=UPI001CC55A26|nr:SURP and G-patch domain-containing protein 1-like protein isoform X1 [Telopea speciosissima]